MTKKIETGDVVRVHYTGKLDNGQQFDSSKDRDPLIFVAGKGMMIKGFDEAVMGKEAGDNFSISIAPEKAYGEWKEENVHPFPKEQFPDDMELKKGMPVTLTSQDNKQVTVKIHEIGDEKVNLDANHMLAGQTLHFDLEIIDINDDSAKDKMKEIAPDMMS